MNPASLRALYLKPATLISYMLQSTEYDTWSYLKWYWRTQDFGIVMHRRSLDLTRRARLLRSALRVGMLLQICAGLGLIGLELLTSAWTGGIAYGAALLVSYPVVWAHAVVVPLIFVKHVVVMPADKREIAATEQIFAAHSGIIIAVLGSYGKTTMKELLTTILGTGLKVAATPGNKNVSVSHAAFARSLAGDEDVLIIEYGEASPGDIARFARHTHPTHAVITGVAAAHMDGYKSIARAAEDIFSITDFVDARHVYVNAESPHALPYTSDKLQNYSGKGVADLKVADVTIGQDGTGFVLARKSERLELRSGLLGRHQIGPLSAAIALARHLGVTPDNITRGVGATAPFEHRLQPYNLGGACILDDTYNGNLEGVRAGTALLGELTAKRKWYVTPGLVEQGAETAAIHREVGRLAAAAKPDIVVLMQNSVTEHIRAGLAEAEYSGEIRLETDPLNFYTNLNQFVAAGDLVLMQNDWTDNYA